MARRSQAAAAPRKFDYDDLLAIGHRLADLSGAAILPQFRKRLAVDNKAGRDGYDPVTAADRAAERAIRKELSRTLPEHGIVGEEYGKSEGTGRYNWVIDPIDGTRGFITGLPTWGTLIGLMDGSDPLLGIMDQPHVRERFWAGRKASFVRDAAGRERRLRSRPCASLADAMLSTTSPELFAGADAEAFTRIRSRVRSARYGGDCYAYCMVAAGHVDIVVECGLQPYDVVALIPIIERAGGRITTWDGRPATEGGRVLAAGDPRVHAAAVEVLSG